MRITNKFGCEEIFVRALKADPYSKGDSDFSATELIKPARQAALARSLGDDLEVDASRLVASALGTAWHSFIEKGARPDIDIVEKRYFAKFGDYIVSAQIDLLETDTKRLLDWKTTKTYPFTSKGGKGQKPEWTQQLNIQLEILRQNGMGADSLHITGVLKDHDKKCLDMGSRHFMAGYPPIEMMTVDLPIWPRAQAFDFIMGRIEAHVAARKELPQCSSSETWGGNMCKSYCDVALVCDQYKKALQTGVL